MVLKWVIVGTGMILFQHLGVISSVEAGMECHYCGMRGICTLPYVAEKSGAVEKINCTHSCMKFDGADGNGKRVVVATTMVTPDSLPCLIRTNETTIL